MRRYTASRHERVLNTATCQLGSRTCVILIEKFCSPATGESSGGHRANAHLPFPNGICPANQWQEHPTTTGGAL